MRRFYLENGKLGKAPPDLNIFHLALKMNKDPEEIRHWDMRDIHWLQMIEQAQHEADQERAHRQTKTKRSS